MRLELFRIQNFRSINDSGDIDVSRITALLGRNESGKSNLLLALQSLNPPDGFKPLNPIKDFPRHRILEECNGNTPVVSTLWSLTEDEQSELVEILPRAEGITQVRIGRWYREPRWVGFEGLREETFDEAKVKRTIRKIAPAVKAQAAELEGEPKAQLEAAAAQFEKNIVLTRDHTAWTAKARSALSALRQALAAANVELPDKQEKHVDELEELIESLASENEKEARSWAISKMPIFVYLDEYPGLNGHQSISEFLQKRNPPEGPKRLSIAEQNFEKLCKVAGLSPETLNQLLGQKEPETRNQLANRASAVVTQEIRRLWKDRALKVRFNLDADYMDTFVSDPNAVYEVEVNLDERSRGFKWFFSFYITFSADTKGGEAENAILLLDEPGLYLHAKSQADLLTHFKTDFENQIIYTTHSPFMVPTDALNSIRTVNITENTGTTVTNDPSGDSRTLFPIQAALGYDLAQSLFIGPYNLVVEGVTDYWMLSSISDYLRDIGRTSLHEDLTITPAGGAQKINYMVALLTSEQLRVLVLLDEEPRARETKDDIVKAKLIREQNVVFVSEAFENNPAPQADIEDLLDSDVYLSLVKESYAQELKGKSLNLNTNIPRIAKRVEAAFKELTLEFHKTRPTRLLLKQMASKPESIVTENARQKFEKIFATINERLEKNLAREDSPFNRIDR